MNRMIKLSDWCLSIFPRLCNKEKSEWGGLIIQSNLVSKGMISKLKSPILYFIIRIAYDYTVSSLKYSYFSDQTNPEIKRNFNIFKITVRRFFTFIYSYFLPLGFGDAVQGHIYFVYFSFSGFMKNNNADKAFKDKRE